MSVLPDENRSFQIGAGVTDKDKVEMLLLVQSVEYSLGVHTRCPG